MMVNNKQEYRRYCFVSSKLCLKQMYIEFPEKNTLWFKEKLDQRSGSLKDRNTWSKTIGLYYTVYSSHQ